MPGEDTSDRHPPRLRGGRAARWKDAPVAWRALEEAHRHLRIAASALDREAGSGGWAAPFSPVRFLVLARLHRATAFGLTPSRLARLLGMHRSSLAHHLDVLEGAGLVVRAPGGRQDARKVAVRLTERGIVALGTLGAALDRAWAAQRRAAAREAEAGALRRPTPR